MKKAEKMREDVRRRQIARSADDRFVEFTPMATICDWLQVIAFNF